MPEDGGFPTLTVADNLRIGALLRSADEWIDEVLETFPRLRQRMEVPTGALSGGEQQMLAMGRAVLAEPKVLLVDEPSLGLAPIMVMTG